MNNFEGLENNQEKTKQQVEVIKQQVEKNCKRVAELGGWPEYVNPESILERIPTGEAKEDGKELLAPGFDAGIACSLNLIPEEKQKLSAELHANYSKEAVEKIRKEVEDNDADSETAYWLSASLFCNENGVSQEAFLKQVEDFKEVCNNKEDRLKKANEMHEQMISTYKVEDDVPLGTVDGCIQGAYIGGHNFGAMYSEECGIYFIGTYEDSLGLEDFEWSDEKDEQGRDKSGPVFGSKQFIKCSSEEEYKRAVEKIKKTLLK